MKVHQILVTLAYGDGVGNDVMAIYEILKKHGYEADIYAQNIDSRITCEDVHEFKEMPELAEDDLILYHLSIGTDLNEQFPEWKGKKIIVYHNITPPQWFEGLDENSIRLCTTGLLQTRELAKYANYCFADSEFNKQDLISMGYQCPIDVLPIIIPFEDYDKEPDKEVLVKYQDDYVNVLFAGRISPNKKQEDVIRAFAEYQKNYNEKSRLFLVGAYAEESPYYQAVRESMERTGAQNVIFTGHIPFAQILSYFHAADLFLCMSEHEGFCIPLLEAMHFELPVLAYSSTAVPYTLGGSGILFDEKDYDKIAAAMDKVVKDSEYCRQVIGKQNERLKDFQYEKIEKDFISMIERFLEEK